jgi:hypothetical protein
MNDTTTKISIASIKIDGHSVEVPVGLSELLESTWEVNPPRTNFMKDYRREVTMKGDRFVTVLRKNKKEGEKNGNKHSELSC